MAAGTGWRLPKLRNHLASPHVRARIPGHLHASSAALLLLLLLLGHANGCAVHMANGGSWNGVEVPLRLCLSHSFAQVIDRAAMGPLAGWISEAHHASNCRGTASPADMI
jgi:hypothetical protein